jgi:hypothetical protein
MARRVVVDGAHTMGAALKVRRWHRCGRQRAALVVAHAEIRLQHATGAAFCAAATFRRRRPLARPTSSKPQVGRPSEAPGRNSRPAAADDTSGASGPSPWPAPFLIERLVRIASVRLQCVRCSFHWRLAGSRRWAHAQSTEDDWGAAARRRRLRRRVGRRHQVATHTRARNLISSDRIPRKRPPFLQASLASLLAVRSSAVRFTSKEMQIGLIWRRLRESLLEARLLSA